MHFVSPNRRKRFHVLHILSFQINLLCTFSAKHITSLISILVPSSSGLATLSTPIMGPLAAKVGYSVEVTIMEMVAANGLVNLFTPTCGAILGGLRLAGVEFTTWLKWVMKVILCYSHKR